MSEDPKVYNMVVLGNTGVGKSALMNFISGQKDAFLVGDTSATGTTLTQSKEFKLFGRDDGLKVRLVDTQGLSDSGGDTKDMEHIKNMVENIRELAHVHLFLLCLDSTNPRFTPYLQSTVELFINLFPDFLNHAVLVFNKWTQWNDERKKKLTDDYQDVFKTRFGIDRIPCYFADSFCNLAMQRDNPMDGTSKICALHPNLQEKTFAEIIGIVTYMCVKVDSCNVTQIREAKTRSMLEREKLVELEESVRKQQLEAAAQLQRFQEQQHENEMQLVEARSEADRKLAQERKEQLAEHQRMTLEQERAFAETRAMLAEKIAEQSRIHQEEKDEIKRQLEESHRKNLQDKERIEKLFADERKKLKEEQLKRSLAESPNTDNPIENFVNAVLDVGTVGFWSKFKKRLPFSNINK